MKSSASLRLAPAAVRRSTAVLFGLFVVALSAQSAAAMGLSYTAYRIDPGAPALVKEGEIVQHGEKLTIHIRYINDSLTAVRSGAIVFSLPPGFRLASAEHLVVSVDGGVSFGLLDQLQVEENGRSRLATADDVTHIRLGIDRPIAPGADGEIRVLASLR